MKKNETENRSSAEGKDRLGAAARTIKGDGSGATSGGEKIT
ncbi:hypothetical protein ABIF65_010579 [Bradyrhizobium japonicum]|jgi:hypothetical protein|uniref:CsbD family protein n=1 Tax=Bradyrhizobium japonicum TaxID=375 RepID=A0ABV2S6H0_BRAJP|nr:MULTISPECIES: hypothetical protein [Bradyrhizobium]WLB90459.1 hypothetical protein QIH91_08160 [Bradyrhizobium japonicum USDA 135]GMP12033.1 hypothetical protein BwSH20_68050 [Bradyrhizobium ottawaense]MCP1748499.1 hypothetical protein [Bradyrhizobium japonicum]MCP1855625.1 hypothetical protein [Bradyrhizobium japonicum]MCP1897558.1 hypothetical protein [Bradyrhizobium japonicum]